VVSTPEPFKKLVNQGMILGEVEFTGYRCGEVWISAQDVEEDGEGNLTVRDHTRYPELFHHREQRQPVERVSIDESLVEKQGVHFVLRDYPKIRVEHRAFKMSKSRGNVINPDDIVREYGADSLRLYEMFMGPLEATKPWSMDGVNGVRGFLDRVWRMIVNDRAEKAALHESVQDVEPTDDQRRVLHRTIKAVTEDIETLGFNTAIARMMEF